MSFLIGKPIAQAIIVCVFCCCFIEVCFFVQRSKLDCEQWSLDMLFLFLRTYFHSVVLFVLFAVLLQRQTLINLSIGGNRNRGEDVNINFFLLLNIFNNNLWFLISEMIMFKRIFRTVHHFTASADRNYSDVFMPFLLSIIIFLKSSRSIIVCETHLNSLLGFYLSFFLNKYTKKQEP